MEKYGRYYLTGFEVFNIYQTIKENPGITANDLCKIKDNYKTTISQKLRPLKKEGYVRTERQGHNLKLYIAKNLPCPCCGK